jgi:hypothetical protein
MNLAFLNRGLEISLTDTRPTEPRSVRFRSPGGVRDMVACLDEQEPVLVDPELFGVEQEGPRMAGTVGLPCDGANPARSGSGVSLTADPPPAAGRAWLASTREWRLPSRHTRGSSGC